MSARHTAPLAALAMALALPGCINMAPDHVTPDLPVPASYDDSVRPDGTVVATSLSYQEWFADPRLDALIGAALQNNRDLVAATARIEQARAQ